MSISTTRGVVAAIACTATAGVTLVAAGVAPAGAAGDPAAAPTTTKFALEALAFGSQVTQGDLQTSSGRSAVVSIGCTKQAGLSRARGVDTDELGEDGSVDGVTTRVWTTARDGVVTSNARSRVKALSVGNEAGSLSLTDLVVSTRTWHDSNGFHRRHTFDLLGLAAEVGGVPLPGLPGADQIEPGQAIEVPGVVTLTFDRRTGRIDGSSASATSTGLTLDVVEGARSTVGVAASAIGAGVAGGVLGGKAESAYSGDGVLTARNVIKKSVPCRGTGGEWSNDSGTSVHQPGLTIGQVTVGALGDQTGRNQAVSRTRAETERVSLGNGQVIVRVIRSQANVVRDGDTYTRSATGSSIGRLIVGGEQHALPDPGESLEIPGVAVITPEVVSRTANSITVVGLRIALLGGADAGTVVDIARSSAQVKAR